VITLKQEDAGRIALKICDYMNTSRHFSTIVNTIGKDAEIRLVRFFATLTVTNHPYLRVVFNKDYLLPRDQLEAEAIAILKLYAKKTPRDKLFRQFEKHTKKLVSKTEINVIELSEFVNYITSQA
jgi:hypothetical protein